MVRLSRRQFVAGVGATVLARTGGSTPARPIRATPVPPDVRLSWPSYRNGPRNTGAIGGGVEVPTPVSEEWSVRGDFTGPVVGGGYVFLSTPSGDVRAVDPISGRTRWRVSVDNRVAAAPSAGPSQLFVPMLGGQISAIGFDRRDVQWSVEFGEPIDVPPVVAGDHLYVATLDGSVIALDRNTGRMRWQGTLDDGVRTMPAVVGDTVYAAARNTLYAFRDGSVVWELPVEHDVETAVVVQGDQLVVGLAGGRLQTVDRERGTPEWTVALSGDIAGAPAVTDDNIFATTRNGWVQAFWSDGDSIWAESHANGFASPPTLVGDFLWVVTAGGRLAKLGVGAGSATWSTTGLGRSIGLLAGHGVVILEGNDSVSALFHPTSLEARRTIRRLSSRISGADPAVDLGEARDLLSRSASAFTANDYRQSADLAEQGIGSIDSQLDARRTASSTIEDLSRRIDQATSSPRAPDSCSGDELTFDGLDVGESDSSLSDARAEYDAGDYAAANRTATTGLEEFEAVTERATSAREAIDSLGGTLAASETAKSPKAEQGLADACAEYAAGNYGRALTLAEEGRQQLEDAEVRAGDASTQISELEAEIAAATSDDLKIPTARERLSLAQDRYDAGNYTGARAVATAGLEAVAETRTKAERARDLMDKVEAADHPETLEEAANVFGRNDLLQRAEAAYAEGRYSEAIALARKAREWESRVTWGFGVLSFGSVGAYLAHRRRGGAGLFDTLVGLVHED